MNPFFRFLPVILAVALEGSIEGQGFINLNFESASIPSGTQPGAQLPIASALPAWGNSGLVWYDGLSLGGPALSVIDSNCLGASPLQGRYSAYLFGGYIPGVGPIDVSISQTATVPAETSSLLLDAHSWYGFTVSLGGQTLTMQTMESFASYNRYGADVSSFAGQTAELRITAPCPYGTSPNGLLLDNIVFSPAPVPEPKTLLLGFVAIFLCLISHSRRSETPPWETYLTRRNFSYSLVFIPSVRIKLCSVGFSAPGLAGPAVGVVLSRARFVPKIVVIPCKKMLGGGCLLAAPGSSTGGGGLSATSTANAAEEAARSTAAAMSPEERLLMIEAHKERARQSGSPSASLFPPTMLSPAPSQQQGQQQSAGSQTQPGMPLRPGMPGFPTMPGAPGVPR